MKGDRPNTEDIKDSCPKEIIDLMKHCWQQKPENRPTFSGKILLQDYFCLDISSVLQNMANELNPSFQKVMTFVCHRFVCLRFLFKIKINLLTHTSQVHDLNSE